MPARIGDTPLSHLVVTRLDAGNLEKLNQFSAASGFKRCTLVRLAVLEYISKPETLVHQVCAKGSGF